MRATAIIRSLLATAIAAHAAISIDLANAQNCVSVSIESTTNADGPTPNGNPNGIPNGNPIAGGDGNGIPNGIPNGILMTNPNGNPNGNSPTASADTPIQDGAIATAVVTLNPAFANNPPAEVEVSAPGLLCGRSKFTFSKTDKASHTQRVTCRTAAGAAPASTPDGSVVDVPVTLTYRQGPRASDAQRLKRKVVNSGRCSGWGDPHLTTLDGVAYDFQKQGVFKYVEAGSLQVQVFQEKCGDVARLKDAAPSCYQGVAVAFGASLARFFIVNGQLQAARGSASLQWLSVERLASPAAQGFRVFANVDHATYVDINLDRWGDYPLLNVALQLSPYFKAGAGAGAGAAAPGTTNAASGLMGNWNGNRNDDVTNSDQLAQLHGVSLDSNLFTCVGEAACAPMLKASTIHDSNALALTQALVSSGGSQPLLHQGYAVVAADAIPLRGFSPKLRALALRRLMGQDDGVNMDPTEGDSDSDDDSEPVREREQERANAGRLLRGSAGYLAGQVATTPDGAMVGGVGGTTAGAAGPAAPVSRPSPVVANGRGEGNGNGNGRDEANGNGNSATTKAGPSPVSAPAPVTKPLTKPNPDTTTKDNANANTNPSSSSNPTAGAKTTDVSAKTGAKTDSNGPIEPNTNANAVTNANANTNTNNDIDVTPRATQLCQQVLSTIATTCGKYVRDTDHHIHTRCIADTALMRDLTIVDHAKLGYLRECRRELDARLSSQTACATETKALQKDRDALFFGDLSRCAKQCSGRGKCLAAGCQCDAGYTGLGCDVKI